MPDVRVLPCTLALFGALGDLALRKLFPALYQLDRENLLHRDTRVLALARDEGAPAEHLATLEQRLRLAVPAKEWDDAVWQRFRERLDYLSMDFLDPQAYVGLREAVDDELPLVAYFATPASVFGGICENLAAAGLAERTRVVLEKPIGHDLESSREVNEAVARFFPESRIYRIDHYLGKETVQNLIALRFANSLFETQWNQNHISHVEITVAEKVGIEGRWGYFDQAGQLRDMVQNHLLQLLCLIAMDPPSDLSADSIRDEKVKVLRALEPIPAEQLASRVVRGSTPPVSATARQCRATWRRNMRIATATRKPSSPCAWTSATGAGRACRSTCAPASACRRSCRRSSSTSRSRRTTSSLPSSVR